MAAGILLLSAPPRAAGQASSVDLKNAALISRGSEVFAKSCAVGYCHGSEGRASRGPQLRDRPWDPRHVHAITRDGVPGTSCRPGERSFPSRYLGDTAYVMSLSSTKLDDDAAVIALEAAVTTQRRAPPNSSSGHDLFFD